MREVLQPADEQQWREWRADVVTSTEVSALFDCNPYCTAFELHHRKKNREIVECEPTERVRWGTRLQDAIAQGIAEDSGLQVRKMTEFIRDSALGLGASFDFEIVDPGILEVKNVDALQFRDGWIVDGDDIEAPAHIELQVQVQLMMSRKSLALIGALIGGNRVVVLTRHPDERIFAAIEARVTDFWAGVRRGEAPAPDYRRDAALLSRLHGHAEAGKLHDARGDGSFSEIAADYRRLGEEAKQIEEARTALKMQLLERIGDAEKAIFDGGSVTAGMISPARIEYDRQGYRNFRLNWKKGAK